MRESKQETTPKNQSRHLLQNVEQRSPIPDTKDIRLSQPDPLVRAISRVGKPSTVDTHAAMLSRSKDSRNRSLLLQLQRQYGNSYVQQVVNLSRKADSETEAAPEVEAAIEMARGNGQLLDSGVRVQMESAFGVDFSGVRVHTDSEADILNRALDARAFTTHQDIFFGQGEYNPSSSNGRELLAHELTHVVQQGKGLQGKLKVGEPGDKYEQEADWIARQVVNKINSSTRETQLEQHYAEQGMRATADEAVQKREGTATNPLAGQITPLVQRQFSPTAIHNDGSKASSTVYETRGLKPGVGEDELVRGRTVGEFVADVARPIGTAVGNVVGSVAGAITGISIASTTNTGPTWNPHGAFDWQVGFTTTGGAGWIIQEVVNSWRAQDALGNAIPNPFTPHYWEAWGVNAAGNITPSVGGTNDFWTNPNFNAALGATEGHWATTGHLYFTTTNPATMGFVANNPATNAGILLSTTAAPPGLGVARLHRYAQGTWDSTGVIPTHTGSAGP